MIKALARWLVEYVGMDDCEEVEHLLEELEAFAKKTEFGAEIIAELRLRYPDGPKVSNLNELKAENPDLKGKINALCRKAPELFDMKLRPYLVQQGRLSEKKSKEMDDYMAALDMFMMAEELGGPGVKPGESLSSDGVFDIVIAKAEEGAAEAKFTAGKYFLADYIEEERERAVQWIKEAAEAGVP